VSTTWWRPDGNYGEVLDRPEREVSYLRATLKGMALTFSPCSGPKSPCSTPSRRPPRTTPSRTGGVVRTACSPTSRGAPSAWRAGCARRSAGQLHQAGAGEDEEGNRYPLIYEIDEFRCVFCGYCQKSVRKSDPRGRALRERRVRRGRFVYDLERLCSQTHPVSTLWDPSDPKGE